MIELITGFQGNALVYKSLGQRPRYIIKKMAGCRPAL